jgi:hypothetical protein
MATQTATELTIQRLKNESSDKSVSPVIPREGMMGRASAGTWHNVLVDTDGKLQTAAVSSSKGLQFDTDSGVSTTFYLGTAATGTATSAASWAIQKITTASGVQMLWADGNSTEDNIWDNRESLSYS